MTRPPSPIVAAVRTAQSFGRAPSDEAIEAWNYVLAIADSDDLIRRATGIVARMTTALVAAEGRAVARIDRAELDRQRLQRRRAKNREKYLRRLGRPPGPPGRPVPPPFLIVDDVTVVCETKIGAGRRWLIESDGVVHEAIAVTAASALADRSLWSASTATPRTVALILGDHARGSTRDDWVAEPPRDVVPCRGYFYVGLKPYRCASSAAKALVRARAAARGSRTGA